MPRDFLKSESLKSSQQFSRDVIMLDDCEGTCNWSMGGSGAAAEVSYETEAAHTGTKGLKIATRPEGGEATDFAQAIRVFGFPMPEKLTIRMHLNIPTLANITHVQLRVIIRNGATKQYATLRYEPATPKFYYVDVDGDDAEITELAYKPSDNSWQQIELKINLKDMQYISASMFGAKKDLAGTALHYIDTETDMYLVLYIECKRTAAGIGTIYADNIYIGCE